MSSDLLKEFGKLENEPWAEPQSQSGNADYNAEEEEFGEFQEPETQGNGSDHRFGPAKEVGSHVRSVDIANVEATNSYALSWELKGPQKFHSQPEPTITPRKQVSSHVNVENSAWSGFEDESVLFDAESMPPSHKPPPHKRMVEKALSPAPQIDIDDQFDAWEPEDTPQTMVPAKTPRAQKATPTDHTEAVDGSERVKPAGTGPPPANIPPPSILLSLSATFLSSIPDKIKNTLTADYEELDQLRIDKLRHLISILYSIARIASGRRLRWKRDIILSQSMKIGPAGKQGGMKLTGIDKTESRREDQEVAEVFSIWKRQVGPLRSMLAMANAHLPGHGLIVPEISENLPVRAGKPREGALTAPKACFLCGLKRDERVSKIDVDVQDSFGEWWTEHWGHVDCVEFWNE
ncbi:MAG: hypothetical protein Q9217_006459, partial [Psora testacea]